MKLFSERYNYTKASDVIIREQITPEIQNAICSCYDRLGSYSSKCGVYNMFILMEKYLWTYFLNKREGLFNAEIHTVATHFLENYNDEWFRKLDMVELSVKYLCSFAEEDTVYKSVFDYFVKQLNFEFERLNFAYRVVGTKIVEITSKEEITAVESAIKDSTENIKMHLNKALELYSQRPNADYRNSIKESITFGG